VGELDGSLTEESYRPTLMALAREAVAVALAQGVRLESFDGFDPEAFHPGGEPGTGRNGPE
jgi:2-dehydropantoate 2-reductase